MRHNAAQASLPQGGFCSLPVSVQTGKFPKPGPHGERTILVRTNPEAIDSVQERHAPLPVGTVVVKEKHASETADGPPNEYGAMVQREPGYDPEHGDWEYVYVTRKPVLMITRGKLASCIDCHAKARDKDYLSARTCRAPTRATGSRGG